MKEAGNALVKAGDEMMLLLAGETAMTKANLEAALRGYLDARVKWHESVTRAAIAASREAAS